MLVAAVFLTLGALVVIGAAQAARAEDAPSDEDKLTIDRGTRVLVTRVRDYYDGRTDLAGSGEVLQRIVFDALEGRGLRPVQGEHAAELNVRDDVQREAVAHVVRPAFERLRLGVVRDARLQLTIEWLGPEVREPVARCEVERGVDAERILAPEEGEGGDEADGDRSAAERGADEEGEAARADEADEANEADEADEADGEERDSGADFDPRKVAEHLVRPAVERCLDELIAVREPAATGVAQTGGERATGGAPTAELAPPEVASYRVEALRAGWLFAGAGRPGYPPAFWEQAPAEQLRGMLRRSDVRLCGEEGRRANGGAEPARPSGEFAAEEGGGDGPGMSAGGGEGGACSRVLAVGVGILRRSLEPPPPASPVHVVAVVTDRSSGRIRSAAVAEAQRALWVQGDPTTLAAMLQRAAERALGARVKRFGPAPSQSFDVWDLELPSWAVEGQPAGRLRVTGGAASGGSAAGSGDGPAAGGGDAEGAEARGESAGGADGARLAVVIGTDGAVEAVEVLDPAGRAPSSLKALAEAWRFDPARRDGEPLPLYVEVDLLR